MGSILQSDDNLRSLRIGIHRDYRHVTATRRPVQRKILPPQFRDWRETFFRSVVQHPGNIEIALPSTLANGYPLHSRWLEIADTSGTRGLIVCALIEAASP